jgi:hypothetical protein
MGAMAKELADEAHFLFIYTRDAHPEKGPDYAMGLGLPFTEEEHPFTAHKTIEQKYEYANIMRELRQTPRTILVDDLEGEIHRAYSGCSNKSWIIDHTGRVHFKANWTVAADLRNSLDAALRIRDIKRDPHSEAVQYWTEGTGYNRMPRRKVETPKT